MYRSLLPLALLLAACGDDPSGPPPLQNYASSAGVGVASAASTSGSGGAGGEVSTGGAGGEAGTGGQGGATSSSASSATSSSSGPPPECSGDPLGTPCSAGICDGQGACVASVPITCMTSGNDPSLPNVKAHCDSSFVFEIHWSTANTNEYCSASIQTAPFCATGTPCTFKSGPNAPITHQGVCQN